MCKKKHKSAKVDHQNCLELKDEHTAPDSDANATPEKARARLLWTRQKFLKLTFLGGFGAVVTAIISQLRNEQEDWHFCSKCHVLFYDGYKSKGYCAASGQHEAAGYNFVLLHNISETSTAQTDWRFCNKCQAMFYQGAQGSEYDQRRGVCAAGGKHEPSGYNFVLPHDVPGTLTAQTDWRFCNKCQAMFYQGAQGSEYDQRRGVCAAGGEHEPVGYNFVLPWREPQILKQSFISTQFETSQCIILSKSACSCSTLA
ncbi:hypothetical protein LC653_34885 [Nostoc sp. CHAB 5784]|uniref:hypothetical protein n=1 Tax=Nostoc mirabile TaxID=2907820 RepID=UPI001E53F8F7|nr:hypothetical protein [Nostoc mirabile]MCC5668905.1 hypothetical protein [Nostoc mirabile CHAB5784]